MYLEEGNDAIAPALVAPVERKQLARLHKIGALTESPQRTPLLCPQCETQVVQIRRDNRAQCPACGYVALKPSDRVRWKPDSGWVRRRISQALGVRGVPQPVLPERVWRIGDVGRRMRRRRVLFGQQLTDLSVQHELHALWPACVGDTSTILITTTPLDRIRLLPLLLPVEMVSLSTGFHLHGTGLVADGPVWEGVLAPATRAVAPVLRNGPFAADFSAVLLPDGHDPIALTSAQASLMRVLWEGEGRRIAGRELIRRAHLHLSKPADAFPKNKYPEANRAYRMLVRSNRRSEYWMQL